MRSVVRLIKRRPELVFHYVVLTVLAVFAVFPFYWMVTSSLKTFEELYRYPPQLFPRSISLLSYEQVLVYTPFLSFFVNSVIIAVATTVISITLAVMAGYGLARLRFRGKLVLTRVVLFAYLFPPILLVIPLFVGIARMGLANTHQGLVLAYITFSFPFSMWLLSAYFQTIPLEIEEAARVDGASNFGAFWHIAVPLAAPGIATAAIFTFINAWSEFLYALVILGGGESRTLPVGLYNFIGGEFMEWGQALAATTMIIIPTLIFFLFVQGRIVEGLTGGAIKG